MGEEMKTKTDEEIKKAFLNIFEEAMQVIINRCDKREQERVEMLNIWIKQNFYNNRELLAEIKKIWGMK